MKFFLSALQLHSCCEYYLVPTAMRHSDPNLNSSSSLTAWNCQLKIYCINIIDTHLFEICILHFRIKAGIVYASMYIHTYIHIVQLGDIHTISKPFFIITDLYPHSLISALGPVTHAKHISRFAMSSLRIQFTRALSILNLMLFHSEL